MKEGAVGKTCGTDGGEQKCIHSFGGENLKERYRLKNLSIDRVI
jgi:hypothetical protein